MTERDSLRALIDDYENRRISRRSFVRRGAALGLSARALTVLLGAAGIAAPVTLLQAAAQESGGQIAFAVTSDPETLDPQMTSNSAAWTVFTQIHSSLVYQDLDLTYKGLLAESWEISDDNLDITFKLREGITFHDGSPFNADAVKYTFDRLAAFGAKSPNYELAQNLTTEVIDPLTIRFTFEAPNAAFFNAIEGGYGGILSPSATEAAGDNYGRQPIGTNAYQLKDWQTGSMVTLEAFPNFAAAPGYYENKGAPYIQEMVYKVIPDSFAQVAALETGEVDAVDLSATDLPRFENDDRYEIFSSRATSLMYLGLTLPRPMMSDPQVRRAIAHAINRDEIVNTLYEGGLAEACYTPLPPSVPGYDPSLADLAPEFDIEAAKALLEAAGWVEGADGIREKDSKLFQPELYTTSATGMGQLATLIQAQLRVVGIDVQINQMELAALLDFTPRGEHDMLLLSWGWSDPDVLYLFLSSDRLETSNRVHYSNPEFDALLVQGQQTVDQAERMKVYFEAQKILLEDLPWVPLFMPITKTAVNTRIRGVKTFPTGGLLLNDAWVEA